MKKLLFILAIAATSFTCHAQQQPQQPVQNAISINPVEVTTTIGRDTVNAVSISVGSLISATDSFQVSIKYLLTKPDGSGHLRGINITPINKPFKVSLPLATYLNITAGSARLTAIQTAVLSLLSLTLHTN